MRTVQSPEQSCISVLIISDFLVKWLRIIRIKLPFVLLILLFFAYFGRQLHDPFVKHFDPACRGRTIQDFITTIFSGIVGHAHRHVRGFYGLALGLVCWLIIRNLVRIRCDHDLLLIAAALPVNFLRLLPRRSRLPGVVDHGRTRLWRHRASMHSFCFLLFDLSRALAG